MECQGCCFCVNTCTLSEFLKSYYFKFQWEWILDMFSAIFFFKETTFLTSSLFKYELSPFQKDVYCIEKNWLLTSLFFSFRVDIFSEGALILNDNKVKGGKTIFWQVCLPCKCIYSPTLNSEFFFC